MIHLAAEEEGHLLRRRGEKVREGEDEKGFRHMNYLAESKSLR